MSFTITINQDKKCFRCKEGGATDNGLCLGCISKGVIAGEFDNILDKVKGNTLGQNIHNSLKAVTKKTA